MTILEKAKQGKIDPLMEAVAADEGVTAQYIREEVAAGRVVISRKRSGAEGKPIGIGRGLRTKINANIGTSRDRCDVGFELEKLETAVRFGADTVMDLSTGGDLDKIRKQIIEASTVPVGTVPIYQAAVENVNLEKAIVDLPEELLFEVIEKHGEDGVDFITVHCGVTLRAVERIKKEGRILNVVSRGGAFLVEWMLYNQKENPLYEHYDRLLEIAARYDMTLSLGDGLRPGCLADASDRGQFEELIIIGELAQAAKEHGVSVIVEGPGHMPIHQIQANMQLEKEICHGAPFYVLGPLVTDLAPGYDHITSAIGGSIAAAAGADFLCYVTPSEHLALPGLEDVRLGVICSKIAAHVGDIGKGVKGAMEKDARMGERRRELDWEGQLALCIDRETAESIRKKSPPRDPDVCTMCGPYCSIKGVNEFFKKK